jgi:dUTP pyrophosphatase
MENKEKIAKLIQKLQNEAFRIEVQVLDDGKLPFKVRYSDAGFDVYATSDFELYPGTVVKHPLNIKMKLPPGTWAEITTKSGLGAKGQLVYAGVIDEEYRGIPHVIMTNLQTRLPMSGGTRENTSPISFKKGDKIAQLIMNPYNPQFHISQVDEVSSDTSRGEGGFGSTGNS